MVTEKPDAGKIYPPLPMHEIHKENSALPAIKVQMAQMSRQLTQLIDHLQRLNHQMQVLQEERQAAHSSDPLQVKTESNIETQNGRTRKYQSTEMILNRLGRRKGFYKYINGILIFFLIIGIVAAFISALLLLFHGPAMI